MVVVFLDELKDEASVEAIIPELENVVITATTAIRNKRRLIATAELQVRQVIRKCSVNRWTKAQKKLNSMLTALENARAEDTLNLWNA